MALELDTRQRAMLQEMGVRVWLPEADVAILEQAAPPEQQARPTVARPVSTAPSRAPSPRPDDAPTARSQVSASTPVPGASESHAVPLVAASLDWTALTDAVRACQACAVCSGRTTPTLLAPAENLAQCDWIVVGDAPDEEEDRAGAPFAGQDGVLLGNMLRALGLQRANPLPSAVQGPVPPASQRAYLTNVLKCRPAPGAMPQATELAQCAAYLQREIALVQPKLILAMGRYANQVLLAETPALVAQPLGKLRGTLHHYQGVPVVVTYPPKLLMRNSADKAKAWADLCFAAAALEAAPDR